MSTLSATKPDLLATLEDNGHRLTVARRSVIDLLGQKREGFSAQELCEELPQVGRATVYRTIKLLLKASVVCKLALADGAPKYSLARVGHHHHTVCMKCGTVGDFRASTVERILRTISGDIPGELVGHRMELYIICQDCLAGPAR